MLSHCRQEMHTFLWFRRIQFREQGYILYTQSDVFLHVGHSANQWPPLTSCFVSRRCGHALAVGILIEKTQLPHFINIENMLGFLQQQDFKELIVARAYFCEILFAFMEIDHICIYLMLFVKNCPIFNILKMERLAL